MRAGLTRGARGLVLATLGAAMLVLAAGAGGAATVANDSTQVHGPASRLPGIGATDTVRTNIWLARALLAETVEAAAAALPPAPGNVVLRPLVRSEGTALLIGVVEDLLSARGYTLYLDERDIADKSKPVPELHAPAGGTEMRLACEDLTLVYPRVGRHFGLWRQWVDRELNAVVQITIVDRDTGRLFYDERVTRGYGDRVPAGRFGAVRSSAFSFSDAPVAEGGWRRRAEQTIVLGTLAGLVALYFANTGS
ncbi:MAG: hypothetical protein ACYDIE_05995 [Candidatus Krumholzibacteriia bacterium]